MKKVLSIDGGGIRGIIPATVLAAMEEALGKKTAEVFDLVAGTSTGGILALGLTKANGDGRPQYSAADLIELYSDRGGEIFHRSFWRGVASIGGLADEKYSHEPLEKVLQEYFRETTLNKALIDTLVSSYDIERRSPYFFKSWNDVARDWPMWKVARATSAAPTYFEPTDPADFSAGGNDHALIDGGVFVNNPAMCAFAEARRKYPGEEILLVSLGTGELTRKIPHHEAKDWGLAEWALPILSVVFDGVSDAVDYQLTRILEKNFFRFQCRLDVASDDLDNASAANIAALKQEAETLVQDNGPRLKELVAVLS